MLKICAQYHTFWLSADNLANFNDRGYLGQFSIFLVLVFCNHLHLCKRKDSFKGRKQ